MAKVNNRISLYLLVCDFQLSGTFFPNFIFASDNTIPPYENRGAQPPSPAGINLSNGPQPLNR